MWSLEPVGARMVKPPMAFASCVMVIQRHLSTAGYTISRVIIHIRQIYVVGYRLSISGDDSFGYIVRYSIHQTHEERLPRELVGTSC